jgi:hypothetical protein
MGGLSKQSAGSDDIDEITLWNCPGHVDCSYDSTHKIWQTTLSIKNLKKFVYTLAQVLSKELD